MKKILTSLILSAAVTASYAQSEFNFGTDFGNNVFGEFGTNVVVGATATSASGGGNNFPLALAGTIGTAIDFTAFDSTDQIIITGFRDVASTQTSAQLRFYSAGFAQAYRLNFDLTDLATTSGDFVVGTIGDLSAVGGVPTAVNAIGFQIQSGPADPYNFTIDNVSIVAVPEPSSYALISGALALGWIMVRRRK